MVGDGVKGCEHLVGDGAGLVPSLNPLLNADPVVGDAGR